MTDDGNQPSVLDPSDWAEFERVLLTTASALVEYLRDPADRRRWKAPPASSLARVREPFTEHGRPLEEVVDVIIRDVLPYSTGNTDGRMWAWVGGTGTAPGLIADVIASAMNSINLGFDETAATHLELHLLDELKRALGFPADSSGILTNGTSTGTLIGLAAAREAHAGYDVRQYGLTGHRRRPLRVYCSSEVHKSGRKAANLLGFGERGTCMVPATDDLSMDVPALRESIEADIASGWQPVAVIATVGTVNTGAVDDMAALRSLCDELGVWLHVDAAYGAALLLLPNQPPEVTALREADSVAFDLHKWFYQQYDIGAVFVRDATAHRAAFAVDADYCTPTPAGQASGPTDFSSYGLQLSRSFRALRAWLSIKHLGWRRFRIAVARNLDQARYLTALVRAHPDLQLCAPTRLNVVNFRYAGAAGADTDLDAVNRSILIRLQTEGIAMMSSTIVHGIATLRAAIVNHRTTYRDLEAMIGGVVRFGNDLTNCGQG